MIVTRRPRNESLREIAAGRCAGHYPMRVSRVRTTARYCNEDYYRQACNNTLFALQVQYCCEQFDGIYFPPTTSNGFYCSLRPTYYHSAIYFLLYQ